MTIGLGLGITASGYVVPAATGRTAKTITASNQAQVDTAQSKFGGASFLGDGTGDYLTVASDNDFLFGAETNSWTIEFFMRSASFANIQVPISNRVGGAGAGQFWCEITTGAKMYWALYNSAGTPTYVNLALAGTAFSTNTWYHVALVNNGGTAKMYINGTQVGANATLSGTYGSSTRSVYVAGLGGAYNFNGHLDEIRISTVARYTGSFTPTTTPFVNDSDTILLIHADGTDGSTVFTDDNGSRTKIGISAIGNAQVDTAQSKFGGASLQLDGTGDFLTTPYVSTWNLNNTSDFTIECFLRLNSKVGFRGIVGTQQAGTTNGWGFYHGSSGQIIWIHGTNTLSTGNFAANLNQWYHVVVQRLGTTTLSMYVDGVRRYNNTNYTFGSTSVSTDVVKIGSGQGISTNWDGVEYEIDGYIDELRISDIARYSGTPITVPTAPFVNDANTLLLLHMNGTDGSTVFEDDNT